MISIDHSFDILIVGVGGQGSVLAAKLLATMAHNHGFGVRTAETIGMAQRGGSVVSHVRITPTSDQFSALAPLMAPGTADVVIAFEPGEALRQLAYLAPTGHLISATTPLPPAGAANSRYSATALVEGLTAALAGEQQLSIVDDQALLSAIGNRRCLNTALLACAIAQELLPFNLDDLRDAVSTTVKPRLVDINKRAIDCAAALSNDMPATE